MRLKISLHKKNCRFPLNYQYLIQGMIYDSLPKEPEGSFYHDVGYSTGEKKYKMFVFSNLIGKNHIDITNRTITFNEDFLLFFASEDEGLVRSVYRFFQNNQKICIGKEIVDVIQTDLIDNPYFKGKKTVTVRTLSPLVAYRTDNNYVTYYRPSSHEFEELVLSNLKNKMAALHLDDNPDLKIDEVISEKKRMIHYKNTFYESYFAVIQISTDCRTLSLLLNTGISAKGSAGFGMLEVIHEKDFLSL